MGVSRSPFLEGGLAWINDGEVPDRCDECGYEWSIELHAALDAIVDAPARYADILDGRDGMIPPADGGWNATAYLWHLTDLARSWSERWVQVAVAPGSLLAGWDPDELAAARNYQGLPTVSAMWALTNATAGFVDLTRRLEPDAEFLHGDWGPGTVLDGTRWLTHEYVHHQLDVDRRAGPPVTSST